MYVNFEFAALFPSPYSRVKKCTKFKTNIHLVSVDSFLYYLSSSGLKKTKRHLLTMKTFFCTFQIEAFLSGRFTGNLAGSSSFFMLFLVVFTVQGSNFVFKSPSPTTIPGIGDFPISGDGDGDFLVMKKIFSKHY